jgi:hypothetical protein
MEMENEQSKWQSSCETRWEDTIYNMEIGIDIDIAVDLSMSKYIHGAFR